MTPFAGPILSAGLSAVITLGGVPIQVSGAATTLPKQPDPAHMEVVWPTSQLAPNTSVLMDDTTRWVVKVARRLPNGAVQVSIQPDKKSKIMTNIIVGKTDLDKKIWWVGDLGAPPVPDNPKDKPEPQPRPTPPTPGPRVPTPPPVPVPTPDPNEPPPNA